MGELAQLLHIDNRPVTAGGRDIDDWALRYNILLRGDVDGGNDHEKMNLLMSLIAIVAERDEDHLAAMIRWALLYNINLRRIVMELEGGAGHGGIIPSISPPTGEGPAEANNLQVVAAEYMGLD